MIPDIHADARSSDVIFALARWKCSLQLLIQPWICAPGTHYGLGERSHSGIQSLPDNFTHDQHWESNPRPSDLGVQCPVHLVICSQLG